MNNLNEIVIVFALCYKLLYLFIEKIKVLESNNEQATNKQINRISLYAALFFMLFLTRYQAPNLSEKPLSC